jgi:hypothetical protein
MRSEATPTDANTGQPLLVAPRGEVRRVFKTSVVKDGKLIVLADKNHVHHPELHPLLQTTDGQAVQASRVQRLLRPDHVRYHQWWNGPPLPRTSLARLTTVLLNAAQCIPQQAIHLDRRRPYVDNLNHRQMYRLRASGEVHVDAPSKAASFLQRQLIIGQDRIRPGVRDEFLRMDPANLQGVREHLDFAYAGSLVVLPAIRAAVSPVAPLYEQAFDEERLAPNAPPTAHEFVYQYLGGASIYTLKPLLVDVRRQLLVQAGEQPFAAQAA